MRARARPTTRFPSVQMLRSRLSLLILGVTGFAVAVGWCTRDPARLVDTAPAVRADLHISVSTNGMVEPLEEAIVRAGLDGQIVEVADPGAHVEEGSVVLRLDDGPVSVALAEAQSERLALQESLRAAHDELEQVQRRAKADQELYRQGATTRDRYEESQIARRSAQAHVEHLQQEVPLRIAGLDRRIEELKAENEAAVTQSPFSGTVYRTEYKEGETVRKGDAVMRIADLRHLRVRMNIDQVDLGRVRPGQQVTISSNAYPGQLWSARVSEIVPRVVKKGSRAVADGLAPIAPPAEGLVPGMTLDLEVLVEEVPGVLQVPAGAIFTNEGRPFVYRVEWGRAQGTAVNLGRSNATSVEILQGVDENDTVVVGPADGLKDGDRVRARSNDDGTT